MNTGALNLLVFREERRCVSGRELKKALLDGLSETEAVDSQEAVLRALLRAGELECCVADSGISTATLQAVTDQLAQVLTGLGLPENFASLKTVVSESPVPEEMRVSVPEGFAYYALHPLAYADVVRGLTLSAGAVVVIGIRSIGTTLSAVTAAAVKKSGREASRITVRPEGHAYDRRTQFTKKQLALIQQRMADGADFLIVDEGPGLSGSSFLSVAEALLEAGVPRTKITLICGHEPDFESFCCADGPRRAHQFRWLAVAGAPRKPEDADVYIGGGDWRKVLLGQEKDWPASWINFERLKYLSPPGSSAPRLFKFLGLGHYGVEVLQREQIVSRAGFGPPVQSEPHGFASYPRLPGRPMSPGDISDGVLARIAEYCAFRQRSFRHSTTDRSALQQMAQHNLAQLQLDLPLTLQLEEPVIADGRMQPHEWMLIPDGQMLKTDSGSHGDDHFFPGPTDIAWDLAGAIVEWEMNTAQAEAFLANYRRASNDDATGRIGDFIVAYLAFRSAYCLMAANALHGVEEKKRMQRAAESYRETLVTLRLALEAPVP